MANLTGSTTAVFFVRLSTAVDEIVDVDWNTRDGTAIAGQDYEAASGTVSFLPGETEKAIDVIVYGQDDVSANGKKFYIELKPPANAVLTDALAECVITVADEDGVLVTSLVIAQGKRGLKGDPGLSAYEQAVLMGYVGTVEQWMEKEANAARAAERAEAAAVAANIASKVFASPESGVNPNTGVPVGDYFNVRSPLSTHYVDEYQNIGGAAIPTGKSYPSATGLENAIAATEANAIAAEMAATAANIAGKVYSTPEAGVDPVTGVADGAYFNVRSSSDESYIDEYQNVGGSAVATGKRYLSAVGVQLQEKHASTIKDASGRTQQAINNDFINVKNYGAIGDNTLHTVQEWTVTGSRIYYPNLAAIQVDYPHVTSLSDSIDWAAIQKALDTGRDVTGPSAHYHINKSLYIKKTHQQFKDLGFIRMDASLAKPCLYLGAKDTNGTKSDGQVWFSEISGTSFHGFGNRSEGSAGLSLVSCSQCKISVDARGFHAGIRVDGVCIINTFFQPILLQNTYGLYDPLGHPTISDIQASAFFGGRIEQNEKEGVYSASPNIKFIGTCIEGNGKWDGGAGDTAEVKILAGNTSGAVTFDSCYMESLPGKSSDSIIEIAPGASRFVFINGGEYYGSTDNNKYVVKIKPTASVEIGVLMTGVFLADVINYVSGVISGNSRVSVVNCFPKVDLALTLGVSVGSGSPLIQQIDRAYHRTNQNVRAASFQSDGAINGTTITTTGTTTADYLAGTNDVLGLGLYNSRLTQRRRSMSVGASTFTCIPSIEITSTSIYVFEVVAIQRLTSSAGRAFKALLFVAGNNGSPTILNSQLIWNSDGGLVPTFTSDGTGIVAGNLNNSSAYDFYVTKQVRS